MFLEKDYERMYDGGAVVLLSVFLFVLSAACFGHYPYPCGQDEKAAADVIALALKKRDQDSLNTITKYLGDKGVRIQTGAMIGVMQLVNEDLDFDGTIEAIKQVQKTKMRAPYLIPARDTALIVLDKKMSEKKRLKKLIKQTKSENGWDRRMALEALRPMANKSVLKVLEGLADDPFDTFRGDYFDLRNISGIAFNIWWPIRSEGLTEDQQLDVLLGVLKHGQPYRSRWCDAACDLILKYGQKAVGPLIVVARDGDRNSKLWARRTLRQIGERTKDKKAISALLQFCAADLDSEDRLVRSSAASALSMMADVRVLPELVEALRGSSDKQVRERSAAAMGRIDDKRTIEPLRVALKDSNIRVRVRAAAVLAKKGVSDGDAILIDSIDVLEDYAGCVAVDHMVYISDKKKLGKPILTFLQKDISREPNEKNRINYKDLQNRILSNLAKWDADQLKPMADELKPYFQKRPNTKNNKRILEKLNG